jgi:transcription-repair coupling factor (superfamily II helicase)
VDKAAALLQRVAASPAICAKLQAVADGSQPVVFEHVTESARPFVAALVAGALRGRVWIVCENVRSQELFHNELLNWIPDALFFPEVEAPSDAVSAPDPDISAERLEVLRQLAESRAKQVIVVSLPSLDDAVPAPSSLSEAVLILRRATRLDREPLIKRLNDAGYEHVAQVSSRLQYAVRGGIVDIFSSHHPLPVRIELMDETIESIRHFDLDSQGSVQQVNECRLLLSETEAPQCSLRDYIQSFDVTVDVNAGLDAGNIRILGGAVAEGGQEDLDTAFFEHGLGVFEAGDFVIQESKRESFFAQLREWREQGWQVFIYCNNEGEVERLRDLIPATELDGGRLVFALGMLSGGFTFPSARVAVLTDAELFGRYRNTRARRLSLKRSREMARRAQIDFSELNEGDLVVHLEHGIGKYLGLKQIPHGTASADEALALEFANGARVFVPLEQSFLVSRYVGVGKRLPPLSELGDARWARAKRSAEKAVFDYAAKLLAVHAERETRTGFAFREDNKWQQEFERSFFFKETPDQLRAIQDTKTDMESEKPMDRLICGDVGFGKTEVAIRAAFKAVMNGKQVAVLVPTTVLAQQHYQTFRERMSDYPVTIEMLSRFRSPAEQRTVLKRLRDGSVDIVIGTHRLISEDVQFRGLGLVVVDEEQRFGVLHKERFKSLFKLVDVLTLSATPIPRTLYLSLMGAKDMSIIETPPPNRIPIETVVCGYDERIIRDAIQRELQRQGQVYFLHNRVRSIERIAERVRMLCPGARVEIGHGQMDEHELEEIMQRFVVGGIDVLVSTTIIESGLDIPNANTIIIDRADRFGLADLYQLRGRVGRAQHKAYAYLMLPRDVMTVGAARKRIHAIKQYSSLGAGFKIAMRDLEIRGAGNILGTAQSGHIIAVGFDLYCQLLRQAIARLKGDKVRPRLEVALRIDFVATSEAEFAEKKSALTGAAAPAFLPVTYVTHPRTRIQAYRQLSEIGTKEELDQLRKNWRDRFGPLPEPVENVLLLAEIKLAAAACRITCVETREDKLMLKRGGDYILVDGKFPRLTSGAPNLNLREIFSLLQRL